MSPLLKVLTRVLVCLSSNQRVVLALLNLWGDLKSIPLNIHRPLKKKTLLRKRRMNLRFMKRVLFEAETNIRAVTLLSIQITATVWMKAATAACIILTIPPDHMISLQITTECRNPFLLKEREVQAILDRKNDSPYKELLAISGHRLEVNNKRSNQFPLHLQFLTMSFLNLLKKEKSLRISSQRSSISWGRIFNMDLSKTWKIE